MSILTNGEILHSFIQPVKDRVDHYSDIVSVISSPYALVDADGFDEIFNKVGELITKQQNVITMTDAATRKLFSFKFETVSDNCIQFVQCIADGTAATYKPIVTSTIGSITKNIDGSLSFTGDWILSSADKAVDKTLDEMAATSVDLFNTYQMIQTTVQNIITKGEVNVSNIMSSIKAKVNGARGVAKTYLDDLTDAAQLNNVSSVIEVIKKYLDNNFISASADGTWDFTESVVTKDWNVGFVLSGLANIVQTIGTVVTGLFAPVGLVLSGVGFVANSVISLISEKINSDTIVKVSESEGRELGTHLYADELQSGTVWHTAIGELINGKGPTHFEFLGLDGHAWSTNTDDPDVLVTHDPIRMEFFPSTKGYISTSDINQLINTLIETDIDYTASPLGWDIKHYVKQPYTLKDLAEWYIDHIIPIVWDDLTDAQADDMAGHCWETAVAMYVLIHGTDLARGDEFGSYHCSNSMAISPLTGLSAAQRAILVNYSLPGSDQADFPKTQGYIHEGQETWPWTTLTNADEQICSNPSNYTFCHSILKIRDLWLSTQSAGTEDEHFIAPFSYLVVVRYPLHVLPPAYSRASLIAGIVLTTAIVVLAAAAVAVTAVKINQWRCKQQALTQAKTEKAWSDLTKDPSMANVNAYRKACFKQNTLGKIYGCSSISNKNYWGGGSDEGSSDSSIQSVITLIRG